MPRYHFAVRDGKNIPDHDGVELPDIAAARKLALHYAGELLEDGGLDHLWAGCEWRMSVLDEAGKEVIRLRFFAEIPP